MTYSDIALAACFVLIAVVAIDWRRGQTALGKMRLSKESEPERYWVALGLYLNMSFGLFWLSGQVAPPSLDELADENGVVTLTIEPNR